MGRAGRVSVVCRFEIDRPAEVLAPHWLFEVGVGAGVERALLGRGIDME
jgi:hypothetical protein